MRLLLPLIAMLLLSACHQRSECKDYVACQNAFDDTFEIPRYDTRRFESQGECWFWPTSTADCVKACENAIDELNETAESLGQQIEECQVSTDGEA